MPRGKPTIVLLLALATLVPALAPAQRRVTENTLRAEEGAAPPPATLDDLAWLAGFWRGEGLGGEVEEVWARPGGGTMMGAFKLVKDGVAVFYELMMIVETDDGLVLRLKHFNGDFSAWEEKEEYVSFPLVKLGEQEAWFRGLTFRRREDRLEIYLALHQGGQVNEMAFDLARSDG